MTDHADHPDEARLLDAVEGRAEGRVRVHLEACAACRRRVAVVADGWAEAVAGAEAEVPEPSWGELRRAIELSVRDEPTPRPHTAWRPLGWIAAAAVIVAALAVGPPGATPPAPATLPAWSATAPEGDAGLLVIAALEPSDEDVWPAAPCGVPGCDEPLSDEQARTLAHLLRAEIRAEEDL